MPSSGASSERLLILLPDPLQRLPEAFGSGWYAQQVPAEQGRETPELQPSANRKDRPGHQHPDWVAHHAASCALRHRLVCWCCLNAHWLPFTTIPQCSQVVVGASLTQLEGRSPTSSRRDGSMFLLRWYRVSAGAVVTNPVSRHLNSRVCPRRFWRLVGLVVISCFCSLPCLVNQCLGLPHFVPIWGLASRPTLLLLRLCSTRYYLDSCGSFIRMASI